MTALAEPPVLPELWEHQPNESEEAWEAFVMYRELGNERNLTKVAEILGKTVGMMEQWSARHRWVIRAEAWDRELDRAKQDAARAAVSKAAETMGTRHATAAQMTLEAVLSPIRVAVKRLREDPRFVNDLTTMDPIDLLNLVTKMAKFVPALVIAERLARGEPTEIVGGTIQVEVRPTEAQLAEVLDALVEAKALPSPTVIDTTELLIVDEEAV